MKTGLKILIWSILSGSIGLFGGWTLGGRRINKLQEELDVSKAKVDELMEIANALAGEEIEKPAEEWPKPGDIQKEYLGKTATDEDPPMPEEVPSIGDEEIIDQSPAIEIITEQEYYEDACGYAQEEMIFYSLDQVVWNKDTDSQLTNEEINRSLGYGTLNIFDKEPQPTIFVKNHILQCLFRVDYMEAAWVDEHDSGVLSDEE